MTTDSKKLFDNHGVRLAEQVATERLRRAGVTLGKDLGLTAHKSPKKGRISTALVKRLAGG